MSFNFPLHEPRVSGRRTSRGTHGSSRSRSPNIPEPTSGDTRGGSTHTSEVTPRPSRLRPLSSLVSESTSCGASSGFTLTSVVTPLSSRLRSRSPRVSESTSGGASRGAPVRPSTPWPSSSRIGTRLIQRATNARLNVVTRSMSSTSVSPRPSSRDTSGAKEDSYYTVTSEWGYNLRKPKQ